MSCVYLVHSLIQAINNAINKVNRHKIFIEFQMWVFLGPLSPFNSIEVPLDLLRWLQDTNTSRLSFFIAPWSQSWNSYCSSGFFSILDHSIWLILQPNRLLHDFYSQSQTACNTPTLLIKSLWKIIVGDVLFHKQWKRSLIKKLKKILV